MHSITRPIWGIFKFSLVSQFSQSVQLLPCVISLTWFSWDISQPLATTYLVLCLLLINELNLKESGLTRLKLTTCLFKDPSIGQDWQGWDNVCSKKDGQSWQAWWAICQMRIRLYCIQQVRVVPAPWRNTWLKSLPHSSSIPCITERAIQFLCNMSQLMQMNAYSA